MEIINYGECAGTKEIFGPTKDEVSGQFGIFHNEVFSGL
jgi:hypothetical protein